MRMWDHAEDIMKRRAEDDRARSRTTASRPASTGEGTFYGPKFEYTLKDAIGREWQCGTTQVDFNLPERFGAFYIGTDSEKKQPVMIHRAICGSMERFLGILIENYAGHMPLWFAPLQVVVATITSDADDYVDAGCRAAEGRRALRSRPTCATRRSTTRSASTRLAKVPVILVCGKREAEEGTVNIRRLGSRDQHSLTLDEAMSQLVDEATPPDRRRKLAAAGRRLAGSVHTLVMALA